MTYFSKEENERLEENIKNNAVEHKNNIFDYYKNNDIKEILEVHGKKYNVNLPKEVKEAFTCIDYELSVCSCELPTILDYIIYLQEENRKLRKAIIKESEEYNKLFNHYFYDILLKGDDKE